MKKTVIALLLLSLLSGNLLFSATGTGQKLPDWILEDFDQKVVNVSFVVNDILYAGFSSRQVTQMVPVTSNLPDILYFDVDKDGAFATQPFFLYCIYSTARPVTLTLDFADLSTQNGLNYKHAEGHKGYMYTDDASVPENDRKIEVIFEGGAPDVWPYTFEIIPKKGNHSQDTEYTKVFTKAVSTPESDLLRLKIPKANIPEAANGTYTTVMVLTVIID